jgi:hypothetical protein
MIWEAEEQEFISFLNIIEVENIVSNDFQGGISQKFLQEALLGPNNPSINTSSIHLVSSHRSWYLLPQVSFFPQ